MKECEFKNGEYCECMSMGPDDELVTVKELICDNNPNCYYKQLTISQKVVEGLTEGLKRIRNVNFENVIMNANAFMTSEDAQIDLMKRIAAQAIKEMENDEKIN